MIIIVATMLAIAGTMVALYGWLAGITFVLAMAVFGIMVRADLKRREEEP